MYLVISRDLREVSLEAKGYFGWELCGSLTPRLQPPLCFLWWHPIRILRSGSWGRWLASELRTRASPPSGCLPIPPPDFPLCHCSLISLLEEWMGTVPAALQRPDTVYPGEGWNEPNPGPSCLQHQFPASPREAGRLFWEENRLGNLQIPVQDERVRLLVQN